MSDVDAPASSTSTRAPAIELQGVEFAWVPGRPVIAVPSLHVQRGERIFLRGPSGSGKSTLLALVAGILKPQAGRVSVLGANLVNLSGARRDAFRAEHLGFIFQMFNLVPYLSVLDNVLLPLRFSAARRARTSKPREQALRLVTALGLDTIDAAKRDVTELSVGQQQRVAAARALLGRPDLVIADEPTSSLDAESREIFLELLMRECDAAAATLLFVSHDSSLSRLFDRTVNLSDVNQPPAPEGRA